jgi:hypothetical protein
MDPNATIARILELIGTYGDDAVDEFEALFESLYIWLMQGGKPPVVTKKMVKTNIVICRTNQFTYHLQTQSVWNSESEFEFTVYNSKGDKIHSWPMAYSDL